MGAEMKNSTFLVSGSQMVNILCAQLKLVVDN